MANPIKNLSVYLINLDKSADRLLQAQKEFSSKGLSFERFPAVAGSELSLDYVESIHKNQAWFMPLQPNEIGCYASHINVLKYFLAHSDDEYAFVCEDDIALGENIKEGLELIITHWPSHCDMLKCFGRTEMVGLYFDVIQSSHQNIQIIDPIKVNAGTLCYLVNREGAKKFIQKMAYKRPIDIDLQVTWEHGCRIYLTNSLKNGVSSYAAESDIGGRRHKPFLPHLSYKISFYIRNFFIIQNAGV